MKCLAIIPAATHSREIALALESGVLSEVVWALNILQLLSFSQAHSAQSTLLQSQGNEQPSLRGVHGILRGLLSVVSRY